MVMSSNLRSHNGAKPRNQFNYQLSLMPWSHGVKTVHPSVSKCMSSDSPSNSNLLAGEQAWNSASINLPQAKSGTSEILGLGPVLPGLVSFRKLIKPDLLCGAGVLV